jgi:hypothetical protein
MPHSHPEDHKVYFILDGSLIYLPSIVNRRIPQWCGVFGNLLEASICAFTNYRAPSDSEATVWLEELKWLPD